MKASKWLAKGVGESGISNIYSTLRRCIKGPQVVIVMYHRVAPMDTSTLDPAIFEKQIKFLRNSFNVVSLDAIPDCFELKKDSFKNTAIITFDDGYKDNFIYAYPILKKYGLNATIFLTSGYIDSDKLFWWDTLEYIINNGLGIFSLEDFGTFTLDSKFGRTEALQKISKRIRKMSSSEQLSLLDTIASKCKVEIPENFKKEMMLSWSEVKCMLNNGITFGSHSVNHPLLTQIPLSVAKNEIVQSKRHIEEVLGIKVSAFSYPFGAFNSEIRSLVKNSGYELGLTTYPEKFVDGTTNLYSLTRVTAYSDFSIFKAYLSGMPGDFS